MIRKTTILLSIILLSFAGIAQPKTIRVEAKNLPLNLVFLQLRNQYDFQFSYSDSQLSQYKITVSKSFTSKEEALKYLLNGLPFQLKKIDNVFIIVPEKKEHKKELKQITGQIVEAGSFEPLPFSSILINNHPMLADVTGNFNYTASNDSLFHVRISHLGYYVYDTVLYASNNRQYKLIPSVQNIPEVLIQERQVEKSTMVGESIGKITINHNISRFLPGQGDNSVFNLIRLMPGIQAAGEQSTDLLIWGSYEGQSLVTFDKFTLFGLKNYNDNISVVNPFLVKTIEILKGGFEAKYGDRVGGIVNIVGKNGNMQKPVFSVNINPTTVNGMIEVPLFKKSSLLLAYRQTYYNLYNSSDFNIFSPTRSTTEGKSHSMNLKNTHFDLGVYPDDYQFRDMNLKYSFTFNNGDQLYVSTYGGGDYFHLSADASITRKSNGKSGKMNETPLNVALLNAEKNNQYGLSAFYSRIWSNRLSSKLVFSYSDFSKHVAEDVQTTNSSTHNIYNDNKTNTGNSITENSIRIDNLYHFLNGHQVEFGGGFYNDAAEISTNNKMQNALPIDTINNFRNNRVFVYFDDYLPIGSRFILKTGARLNMTDNKSKLYFEPRISASYKLTEQLKLNASWGRYHQFVYKEASVDKDQNYTYLWITSNGNTPVINATHWVGEINYSKNNLTLNLEAYYKQTGNISERVFEQRVVGRKTVNGFFPYFGNAKTYGIDLFAKKDFGKHSIWATYTLSKALESLAPLNKSLPAYTLAPHHQLHELKVAGLFNIQKFYLSADYVYGSGLQILREVFSDGTTDFSYNRVDAAVTYKFTPKRFTGELGLSVLNVFNTQNLKYSNLRNFNINQELGNVRIYSNAVPFTPTIFLKLVF
jgi:hypothetical protein